MSLIEGFGDEVVQFMAVVLLVLVAALAWWSTNARPNRYHTVLVMRSRPNHPVRLRIRTRSSLMLAPTPSNGSEQASTSEATAGASSSVPARNSGSNAQVIPLQEMDSIVDAHMAMLDNNRLHFYRRIEPQTNPQVVTESTSVESEVHEEAEPASNAQIREMDSIVSAMEADVTAGCDFFTTTNTEANTNTTSTPIVKKDENTQAPSTADVEITDGKNAETGNTDVVATVQNEEVDSGKILIKLKYLNDTLKEVEGSLDESLKDFKRRHFSRELRSECRVRLIFNGRVLEDAATLRAAGLQHRAVVHCLVHPKRNHNQPLGSGAEGGTTHELLTERAAADDSWDGENILVTLVSVAFTIVWFFRCEYSYMFTASASVALFGLTVFYSVTVYALYFSDTFQYSRPTRPTPPQPAN